ncbi:hypothetical protein [Psychroserpens luteolus]|uniref:hypothetical protein n=1 Tax=Psychroserpens luteolus TaxID=2855840 RepID=UPI001E49EA13|nr:hypothetical protein [Psychroserpens luteolus]MCD2259991.1 hypothetical protein [Psychroserpens luteolus]
MKKNIILIITIISLVVLELYLVFYVNSDNETFVIKYEYKDFIYIGLFFCFLFTENKKLGLLFIAAYQIVIGLIYFSHTPGIGNWVLTILHLTAAPVIFFHNWIEEKIGFK